MLCSGHYAALQEKVEDLGTECFRGDDLWCPKERAALRARGWRQGKMGQSLGACNAPTMRYDTSRRNPRHAIPLKETIRFDEVAEFRP
jgi:hypothetical protein